MFNIIPLIIVGATFLLAGGIKGVTGLGLPTISLALLAAAFDVTTGITLIIIPTIVTNIWQAFAGGHLKSILQRLWPFLFFATLSIVFSSRALASFTPEHLSLLLATVLLVYAGLGLYGLALTTSPTCERWLGPLLGTINGTLGGMTGSFVVPGVLYLQSLGLDKERLIQAMGVLFLLSTSTLAISLQRLNLLSPDLTILSTCAVVPAIIGMRMGQKLRAHLPEESFRSMFYTALCLLSLFIMAKVLL